MLKEPHCRSYLLLQSIGVFTSTRNQHLNRTTVNTFRLNNLHKIKTTLGNDYVDTNPIVAVELVLVAKLTEVDRLGISSLMSVKEKPLSPVIDCRMPYTKSTSSSPIIHLCDLNYMWTKSIGLQEFTGSILYTQCVCTSVHHSPLIFFIMYSW